MIRPPIQQIQPGPRREPNIVHPCHPRRRPGHLPSPQLHPEKSPRLSARRSPFATLTSPPGQRCPEVRPLCESAVPLLSLVSHIAAVSDNPTRLPPTNALVYLAPVVPTLKTLPQPQPPLLPWIRASQQGSIVPRKAPSMQMSSTG